MTTSFDFEAARILRNACDADERRNEYGDAHASAKSILIEDAISVYAECIDKVDELEGN